MRSDERAGMEIDFGGVVDTLSGLIWTTQADGRSDFVNRVWRDYTGLGPGESTLVHSLHRSSLPNRGKTMKIPDALRCAALERFCAAA